MVSGKRVAGGDVKVDRGVAKQIKLPDDYDLAPSQEFQCYQQLLINKKLKIALTNTISECKRIIQERVDLIKANRRLQIAQLVDTEKARLDALFKVAYQHLPALQALKNTHVEHSTLLQNLSVRLEAIDKCILCQFDDFSKSKENLESCHQYNAVNTEKLVYLHNHIDHITTTVHDSTRIVSECERMNGSLKNRRLLQSSR